MGPTIEGGGQAAGKIVRSPRRWRPRAAVPSYPFRTLRAISPPRPRPRRPEGRAGTRVWAGATEETVPKAPNAPVWWGSSRHPEILGKPDGIKSQPLATNPRRVCGDLGRLSGAVGFKGPPWPLEGARTGGDCYRELLRRPLPRTRLNRCASGSLGRYSLASATSTMRVFGPPPKAGDAPRDA